MEMELPTNRSQFTEAIGKSNLVYMIFVASVTYVLLSSILEFRSLILVTPPLVSNTYLSFVSCTQNHEY
jgi:hypothetical protein